MKRKKITEMKITYTYIESKTPQEKEGAERRLASAYDILFDETEKRMAQDGGKV